MEKTKVTLVVVSKGGSSSKKRLAYSILASSAVKSSLGWILLSPEGKKRLEQINMKEIEETGSPILKFFEIEVSTNDYISFLKEGLESTRRLHVKNYVSKLLSELENREKRRVQTN